MSKSRLAMIAALFVPAAAIAAGTPAPADAAFAQLKSLAGTWQGKAQWSGGRTDAYELTAVYSVSGHGTAVVENLGGADGETAMTSVYHQDGPDLRMTHYCGVGNQPRLKATSIDPEKKTVRFSMIDMTGRPGPHVGEVELRFLDADHATVVFTFVGGKTPSVETIDMTRNRPS